MVGFDRVAARRRAEELNDAIEALLMFEGTPIKHGRALANLRGAKNRARTDLPAALDLLDACEAFVEDSLEMHGIDRGVAQALLARLRGSSDG